MLTKLNFPEIFFPMISKIIVKAIVRIREGILQIQFRIPVSAAARTLATSAPIRSPAIPNLAEAMPPTSPPMMILEPMVKSNSPLM